ncbi:hypothetical protein [Kribbella catacumbae]|uniref:hypothetical protein n=1 Tax=Kribbella catacumbae TaxID=460086 RepID=UPI0003A7136D|nr:hypothetical protein [Kribbella catacumbae]
MIRLFLSLAFFAALSLGVGFLLSGDDYFDWWLSLSLFGLAVAGEGLRFWIRRGRARSRQSSVI